MRAVVAVLLFSACGSGQQRDDPSAFTELGIPDARWSLGWTERDVAWEDLGLRGRANVLRQELAVLRRIRGKREEAKGLLRELDAVPLEQQDTAAEQLDRLRLEVRALHDEPPGA